MFSFKSLASVSVALATLASASSVADFNKLVTRSNSTCDVPIHLMIAGGCALPCVEDQISLLETLVTNVTAAFPGTDYYLVPYDDSEVQATVSTPIMEAAIKDYAAECPDTPIVFIGYSLGAIVIMNSLCGGIGDSYTGNVLAAILYGDETFRYPLSYDRGTCTNSAPLYPRNNTQLCTPYAPAIREYCDSGDPKCCTGGTDAEAHYLYDQLYDVDATEFIQARYSQIVLGASSTSSSSVVSPTSAGASTTASSVSASTTSAAASTLISTVSVASTLTIVTNSSTILKTTMVLSTVTSVASAAAATTSSSETTLTSTYTSGGSTHTTTIAGVATTEFTTVSSSVSYSVAVIPNSAILYSSAEASSYASAASVSYASAVASSVSSAASVSSAVASAQSVAATGNASVKASASSFVASVASSESAASVAATATTALASTTGASETSATVSSYTGAATRLPVPESVFFGLVALAFFN